MEIYVKYYQDVIPLEVSQRTSSSEQTILQPTPRTGKTTSRIADMRTSIGRNKQTTEEHIPDETRLKQGLDEDTPTSTPGGTQTTMTMRNTAPTITQPLPATAPVPKTTKGTIEAMRITSQGRLSTLSSMVRPTPTTATRTVVITREESRLDALATARQMIGSTSSTAFLNVPTTTSTLQEMRTGVNDEINQSRTEIETRFPSPPPGSRMTGTTAPIRMATPMSQDLIWPGHPDIQGTSLFPRDDDPSTVAAGGLDPEERWKIHHLYNIPGVRRPTMDTPDKLR